MGLLAALLVCWPLLVVSVIFTSEVPASLERPRKFDEFIRKHGRTYSYGSAEFELRRALFEERAARAVRHNSQPGRHWTFDVENSFADRTDEELAMFRGWRPPPQVLPTNKVSFLSIGARSTECKLPASWSWAHLNASHHILNQGSCGSCSALASAAALEAHHEIHRKGLPRTFAPQQMVSCAPNPEACGGEGGCEGGFMELLLNYVLKHGCQEEAALPYTSGETGKTGICPPGNEWKEGIVDTRPGVYEALPNSPSRGSGFIAYERLPMNEAEPLMHALVQWGPVIVALAAGSWHFYGGGVMEACQQDAVIDHAVVLIGFGKDSTTGLKYWHLQNSWAKDWGEDGTLRLERHDNEASWCGIDNQPELGAACAKNRDGSWKKKPLAPVKVCGSCGILFNPVVPHFDGNTQESSRLTALRAQCPVRNLKGQHS